MIFPVVYSIYTFGNIYIRVVLEIVPEPDDIARFMPEIEFLMDRITEFLHHSDDVDRFHLGVVFLHPHREIVHEVKIQIDLFIISGRWILTHTSCPFSKTAR